MKLLILICVIALVGCDTMPAREPVIVTQMVEVPVTVKCQVSYPKPPSRSVVEVAVGATGHAKVSASLQELEDYRRYSKELYAILNTCASDTPPK